MIPLLLRRVVKTGLHQAVEEWLLETGVSKKLVDEVRAQRKELTLKKVEQADALAASRLDIEDEEAGVVQALPMPAAARVTEANEASDDLMGWVHQQRQANVSWADIAQGAVQMGWQGSEDALRNRYRRWREKNVQSEENERAGRC